MFQEAPPCQEGKTRCSKASAILAVVAADAEGSRPAFDAVEAKDTVYSGTASVATICGKASPGSESKAEDHWPAHSKLYNPVTGQVFYNPRPLSRRCLWRHQGHEDDDCGDPGRCLH